VIPYFLNDFDKLNPCRCEDESLHQPNEKSPMHDVWTSDDDDEDDDHGDLTMSNVHAPSDDYWSVEDWSSDEDEGVDEGVDSSRNMPPLEESDDDLPTTTNETIR
jgi:hypothetical protein